jgi:teichuronic acid exporter
VACRACQTWVEAVTIPTRRTVVHGFSWATAGAIGQALSQVVVLVILARFLTPYEFGVASAATIVVQFAAILGEFGVGAYVVQSGRLSADSLVRARTVAAAFTVAAVVGVLGIAGQMSVLWDVPELALVLYVYAITLVARGLTVVDEGLLYRELHFGVLARIDIISFAVGYTGVAIVMAVNGFGYWSIVAGHVSQACLRAGGVLLVARGHRSIAGEGHAGSRDIIRFGAGQSLSRLASLTGSQVDGVVVTTYLGVSAIGVYARANQLVTMPTAQLGQIFDKVLFPVIAAARQQTGAAANGYSAALTAITWISAPVSVVLFLVAPQLVDLILGRQWNEVAAPMAALSIAILPRMVHKVSDPTARAMGATYSRAWRQWVFAGVVGTLALLLRENGLIGIAWAVTGASVLDALLMAGLCISLLGMGVTTIVRSLWPGVALGTIVAAVVLPVRWLWSQFSWSGWSYLATVAFLFLGLLALSVSSRGYLLVGREGHRTMRWVISGRNSQAVHRGLA